MKKTIRIDSTFDQIAKVAQALEDFLAPTPLNDMAAIQLSLAVTEMLNNIVEHGYQGEPDHEIQLVLETTDDAVVIGFEDDSPGYDGEKIMQADIPDPLSMPESGWGMGIIRQSVDAVDYRRQAGKNHTTFTKYW